MSSDDRLARLGLSHLANDPVALLKELQRQIAEDDLVRERGRREQEELRKRLAAEQLRAEAETPAASDATADATAGVPGEE